MTRVHRWLALGLCAVAGLGAALAHPPWGLLPGLLGYALLLWLLDTAGPVWPLRSAFLRGWLAGAAYFAVSLWWVAEAFMVDPAQAWMAPFAVILLASGLGLFWGAAAVTYRALAAKGARRLLLFAGVFAVFEWLRGHVLTGLPWDLPGETWKAGSAPSQAASVFGAYGLTWITLAACAAPAVIREGWKGRLATGLGVAAIAGLYLFGMIRLSQAPSTDPKAPTLRIVQADVKQADKYDERAFASIVQRYTALTRSPSASPPQIVIWPEGAIPADLDDYLGPGAWTADAIRDVLTPGQTLIVGGYRTVRSADANRPEIYFNSLYAVRRTPDGFAAIGRYDKYRLVPFGEFMPMDKLAASVGFKQLVRVGDGFTPGPRPHPIVPPGVPPMQPLICYESLFPGFTREGQAAAGVRAAWIVNLSNDAWFGTTSGPWQHLNIASYRAIEEGLPMVRATPTGVSAIIDAFGRIAPGQALGQGAYGVIDGKLPPALSPTVFNRIGDLPLLILVIFSFAGAGAPGRATLRRT
ncbi:MAG TPA: apolipoprotein N-acyltransferase [Caulobacteraceae bacterium]